MSFSYSGTAKFVRSNNLKIHSRLDLWSFGYEFLWIEYFNDVAVL